MLESHTTRVEPKPSVILAGIEPARFRFLVLAALVIAAAALLEAVKLRASIPDLFDGSIRMMVHQFVRLEQPAAFWTILVILAALTGACWLPAGWVATTLRWTAAHPGVWAAGTALVAALGAVTVHRATPLVMDEYAACFQSQLLVGGRLVAEYPPDWIEWLFPPHPHRSMFFDGSPATGRVVSSYWPGFALLLMPFMALGVPWLLNPLLGAGSVLAVHRFARRISDDPLAPGWAVLLLVASNAFLVTAMTFYSLTAHLFLNLLFALLLLEPTRGRLLGAGLIGSLALVLHNPVPHTAFALPWIVAVCRGPQGWRNLALLVAGYLPLALLLGVGWLVVRHSVYVGSHQTFDSHFFFVASRSFSVPDIDIVVSRMRGLLKLCLWAVPGLPLLAIFGAEKAWPRQPVRLLSWSAVLTLLAYAAVRFDQGHGWGYRYFHAALATLPLLALFALGGDGPAADRLRKLVWILAIISLTAGTAFRLYQVNDFMAGHFGQLPAVEVTGRQVCFVNRENGYYVADIIQNDALLINRRLYFQSRGSDTDAAFVARHFRNPRLIVSQGGHSIWQVDDDVHP